MVHWCELRGLFWWRLIGVGLIVAIIYLSLQSDPLDLHQVKFGDKWGHFAAYGGVMCWFGLIVSRPSQWRFALTFVLLGVGLEFIQGQTGYRTFDVMDMAANSIGVLLGYVICATRFRYALIYLESRLISSV